MHSVIDSKSIPNIHALLSELRAHGLDEHKISVDFAPESPSQTTVATGGWSRTAQADLFEITAKLYTFAAELGYHPAKAFVRGPCMRICANAIAVDERLNVYKCPADFGRPHPDGVIDEQGHLLISHPNWYESVTFEPHCVADCVYAPICYGGCRWLAGSLEKTNCSKEWLDVYTE